MAKVLTDDMSSLYEAIHQAFIGEGFLVNKELYSSTESFYTEKKDVNLSSKFGHIVRIEAVPGLLEISGDGGNGTKIFNMFIYDGQLVIRYYDGVFSDIIFINEDQSYFTTNNSARYLVNHYIKGHAENALRVDSDMCAKSIYEDQVINSGEKFLTDMRGRNAVAVNKIKGFLGSQNTYDNYKLAYLDMVNTVSTRILKEFLEP